MLSKKTEEFIREQLIGIMVNIGESNLMGMITGIHFNQIDPIEVKIIGYNSERKLIITAVMS